MALTQVRAKFEGAWTVLTYNAATGRYEGLLRPTGTSINQPGGYYNIEVEATNESGLVATLTGEQYQGLRLVVRETAAPTLTLVSPPQGWLTTADPTFTFLAQDEAGGSGIETTTARATVDGVSVACSISGSSGASSVTIKFSGKNLSEGPHVVTVGVSDRDGNRTTVSAAYQVDTVPPALTLRAPDLHRVVDWTEITISGSAQDTTSGLAGVTVAGTPVVVDSSGQFSVTVPLEVGVNNIQVTATDTAGLSTTQTVWVLRMITDRTQADVDAVKALPDRWEDFTEEQKAFWYGVVRGVYNNTDMNRVGTAVEYIAGFLQRAGYAPGVSPKTDWTEADAPTPAQRQTYLNNVSALQALLPVSEPQVPPDMEEDFQFQEANDIETILISVDRFFPLIERSGIYSGEAFAGEF